MAPSGLPEPMLTYLAGLVISGVLWHSPETNCTGSVQNINVQNDEFQKYNCKNHFNISPGPWVNRNVTHVGASFVLRQWIWSGGHMDGLVRPSVCTSILSYLRLSHFWGFYTFSTSLWNFIGCLVRNAAEAGAEALVKFQRDWTTKNKSGIFKIYYDTVKWGNFRCWGNFGQYKTFILSNIFCRLKNNVVVNMEVKGYLKSVIGFKRSFIRLDPMIS